MNICLSRFGFIGIVDQDFQSWKDRMIIGWFTTIRMIRNILILTIIAALVPTVMSSVSASAASEIALFSSDSDSLSISGNEDNARMELKATNENGRTKKVSDFQMNADNVLYIKVGDKVTVKDKVGFTKAITTDGNDNQKVIGITSNGVIDFAGYRQGVSTLDVVVDDDRAYEAIIVIGQQPQQVVNREITKVNNKVITDIEIKTVFDFPKYKPIKCDDGYVWDHYKCVHEKPRFKIYPIEQCNESGWVIVSGKCYDQDAITDFETEEECQADPICKAYREQYPSYKEPEPEPQPIPKPMPIGGRGCMDGSTPVNGYCPRPDPNGVYCQALGCPGSPSDDGWLEVSDREPEPIECDEGEELVDEQYQLIPENPMEPDDPVAIDDDGNEGDESDDNSDDSNDRGSGDDNEGGDEDNGDDDSDSEGEDGEEDASGDQDEEQGNN